MTDKKARAIQFLSESGALLGPIEWPEGTVGMDITINGGDPIYVSREEVEAARKVEYWSEALKSPNVVVQVEPEARQ